MSDPLPVSEALLIPADDLSWEASRSPGPGGQHVNKAATKVSLRFDLRGCALLSAAVKARLRRAAGSRLDREGRILITASSNRSQARNLEEARERLRALIAAALIAPKSRKKTRPSRAAKRRRLDGKRKQAEKKQARKAPRES